MAGFYWTGANDWWLDTIDNYVDSGTLLPATVVPGAGDTVVIDPGVIAVNNWPTEGSSAADWIVYGSSIQGGNYSGTVQVNYNYDWGGPSSIHNGTFSGRVALNDGELYGGTFNGLVEGSGGAGYVYGGVFHGVVDVTFLIVHFNGGGIDIRHKLTSPWASTLYSPLSADVAPAGKVLAGHSNLGTPGTLPVARVMQSSGGNLLATDVRNDTATGIAAGGTLDIAADNPPLSVGRSGFSS